MTGAAAGDVPREVRLKVLAHFGGLCCSCGRPCGEEEVWRRVEDGPLGATGPNTFSVMCFGCMAVLVGAGVRPARFVAVLREPGRARWSRLETLLVDGLTVLWFFVWGAFAVGTVWVVVHTAFSLLALVPGGLFVFLLLAVLQQLVLRVAERVRIRAADRERELAT